MDDPRPLLLARVLIRVLIKEHPLPPCDEGRRELLG